MDPTRREFLKLSGLAAGTALVPGTAVAGARDGPAPTLRKVIGHSTTVCPYCGVGCGMIVGVEDGKVVNIEGDPEHPINQGALCSKGSTLSQLVNSPRRITKPAYRAPGGTEWQEVEWGWALDQIAQRIKKTRDAHWIETDDQGRTVRCTEAIASIGSAALDNEEGSITNSGRWAQWRYKAAEPPGEAMPDAWIVNQLMRRLRQLYVEDPGPNPDPILKLAWDYGEGEVDPHQVAKQINGWAVSDVKDKDGNVLVAAGQQVKNFTQLQADGSTACANWLYAGSYNEDGNMMARRDNVDTHPQGLGMYGNWAWAWPLNRRIIYNRASVNMAGEPFDPQRAVITWDAAEKKWVGDVPDGGWPPGEKLAFIMRRGGRARIFGPTMADGPFPEHYEPWESPVMNPLHRQENNPALWDLEKDAKGATHAFPLVGTTYRVSEHWQTGAMTRNLPWLAEMQPEMFVEMSPQLAAERGIANGEHVIVESARGAIEAVALVTPRFQPFIVQGQTVHEIGLPYHWGYTGLVTGGSANELTPPVGDANTMIPETKAFLCNVRTMANGKEEV